MTEEEYKRRKTKFGLLCGAIVCTLAIVVIGVIEYAAIQKGLDGVALASSIGAILGIVAAFMGIKIRDILASK